MHKTHEKDAPIYGTSLKSRLFVSKKLSRNIFRLFFYKNTITSLFFLFFAIANFSLFSVFAFDIVFPVYQLIGEILLFDIAAEIVRI